MGEGVVGKRNGSSTVVCREGYALLRSEVKGEILECSSSVPLIGIFALPRMAAPKTAHWMSKQGNPTRWNALCNRRCRGYEIQVFAYCECVCQQSEEALP
ncbi:hypothetical protein CEXT_456851 [Caerostris extrusa]|uniref:Uncharacterized protein n=1 Tax=Caerostris extrusa TaxID=172846 RepID=A0AAV4RLA2_CAEEX|nr:hypothetical protein CEXT_456851 [Caerostris extrusa]